MVLLLQKPVTAATPVFTGALWAGRGAGWPGHPVPPDSHPGRQLHGVCVACVGNTSPGPRLCLCSLWMETRTVHRSPRCPGLSLRTVEKDFIKMEVRTPISPHPEAYAKLLNIAKDARGFPTCWQMAFNRISVPLLDAKSTRDWTLPRDTTLERKTHRRPPPVPSSAPSGSPTCV